MKLISCSIVKTKLNMNGYMYILECSDGSYYVGSTKYLERRIQQHQNGEGANHTKKRLPVKLLYYEHYNRIDTAFYREKQVQGWSRAKKEALMSGDLEELPGLSMAYRDKDWASVSRASTSDMAKNNNITPKGEALEP